MAEARCDRCQGLNALPTFATGGHDGRLLRPPLSRSSHPTTVQVLYELEQNDAIHKKDPEQVKQDLGNPDFQTEDWPRPDKSRLPLVTLPGQRFEVPNFKTGGVVFAVGNLVKLQSGRGVTGDRRHDFYAHIRRIYRSVEDHDAYNILVQRLTWRPERHEIFRLTDLNALPVRVDETQASSSGGKKKQARGSDTAVATEFIKARRKEERESKPIRLTFLPLGQIRKSESTDVNTRWAPTAADLRVTDQVLWVAVVATGAATSEGGEPLEVADHFLGVHLQIEFKQPGSTTFMAVNDRAKLFGYPTKYPVNETPFYWFGIPKARNSYPFQKLGEYRIQAIGKDHAGNHVTSEYCTFLMRFLYPHGRLP